MCFAPQRRALFRRFFDIRTSKSGPRPSVFNTFDFKMCFAPQRRALFRHLNFQKCSENGVFCAFCLPNVLRATTACTFSTSQLPKVVRSSSVLSILTWKCASRHNGVHFFMSHLASWLRTRRFSEPTFRPSGASNHWKNTVNRDFPIFSRIYLFFLLIFSLLSASSLLGVSTVHTVGSLASKLPSIKAMWVHVSSYDSISKVPPLSLHSFICARPHQQWLWLDDSRWFTVIPSKSSNNASETSAMPTAVLKA